MGLSYQRPLLNPLSESHESERLKNVMLSVVIWGYFICSQCPGLMGLFFTHEGMETASLLTCFIPCS